MVVTAGEASDDREVDGEASTPATHRNPPT
jgi:hypothetical protein